MKVLFCELRNDERDDGRRGVVGLDTTGERDLALEGRRVCDGARFCDMSADALRGVVVRFSPIIAFCLGIGGSIGRWWHGERVGGEISAQPRRLQKGISWH